MRFYQRLITVARYPLFLFLFLLWFFMKNVTLLNLARKENGNKQQLNAHSNKKGANNSVHLFLVMLNQLKWPWTMLSSRVTHVRWFYNVIQSPVPLVFKIIREGAGDDVWSLNENDTITLPVNWSTLLGISSWRCISRHLSQLYSLIDASNRWLCLVMRAILKEQILKSVKPRPRPRPRPRYVMMMMSLKLEMKGRALYGLIISYKHHGNRAELCSLQMSAWSPHNKLTSFTSHWIAFLGGEFSALSSPLASIVVSLLLSRAQLIRCCCCFFFCALAACGRFFLSARHDTDCWSYDRCSYY